MNLYLAKQPIFDMSNNTYAYQLLYRNNIRLQAEKENDKELFISALKNEYEYFMENSKLLVKGKKAFIRFTPELLLKNIAYAIPADHLALEVTVDMLTNKSVLSKCAELRLKNYTIVLDDYLYSDNTKELFKFADMVKFNIHDDIDRINMTIKAVSENGKRCIATHVDEYEDVELANSIGINWVQGNFYSKPVLMTKQSGGPMIRTFLQILALLYCPEPDIEQIAAVISTDPVLTIRLLRMINSICSDTGNTVSTVHQALVLLGIEKLKEWVYLVGLQRLNRNAPDELLKLALFRASFCDRVSRITPGAGMRAKEMYLMGLISIVTGTSGESLANTLKTLPISEEIKSGLKGEGGVYSEIYNLVSCYEQGDWRGVDVYTALCGVDQEALANEYLNSLHFVDKFDRIQS